MPQLSADVATLPAGTYVIADPCNFVPEAGWDDLLEVADFFEHKCHAKFTTYKGDEALVVAFRTANGDGLYVDNAGAEYGVDAGLIGITASQNVDPAQLDDSMHIVEFHSPVRCYLSRHTIVFGHLEIDTDNEPDPGYGDDDDDDSSGYSELRF